MIPRFGSTAVRYFLGQHSWARGYYVSTVGRDEATIRERIEKQREEDKRLDQLIMFHDLVANNRSVVTDEDLGRSLYGAQLSLISPSALSAQSLGSYASEK